MVSPRLDVGPSDRPQRPRPEEGHDVTPTVGLDERLRSRPVRLGSTPRLVVPIKRHLACERVDIGARDEITANSIQEPLGVDLAVEVLRVLRAARIIPPAGPVLAVGPLLDARRALTPLAAERAECAWYLPVHLPGQYRAPQVGGWRLPTSSDVAPSSATARLRSRRRRDLKRCIDTW
jgi:hypothetical protein